MNGLLEMVLSGSVTMHGVLLEIVLSAGLLVIPGIALLLRHIPHLPRHVGVEVMVYRLIPLSSPDTVRRYTHPHPPAAS